MHQLVGSVLYGADDVVAAMVAARIPDMADGFGACKALGVVRRGVLIGGVVYYRYHPSDGDIMASFAFDRPDWCYPQTMRALFDYPFGQLGCRRMTVIVARNNKRSRKVCEGFGFKLEGVMRKAMGRRIDAMIYGMLREECRFLRDFHGQEKRSRSAAACA